MTSSMDILPHGDQGLVVWSKQQLVSSYIINTKHVKTLSSQASPYKNRVQEWNMQKSAQEYRRVTRGGKVKWSERKVPWFWVKMS